MTSQTDHDIGTRVPVDPLVRPIFLVKHDAHVIDRVRFFGLHPDRCPDFWAHTPGPQGYSEWFEWADQMAPTHKQRQCPGCGLYAIWTPRGPSEPYDPD